MLLFNTKSKNKARLLQSLPLIMKIDCLNVIMVPNIMYKEFVQYILMANVVDKIPLDKLENARNTQQVRQHFGDFGCDQTYSGIVKTF